MYIQFVQLKKILDKMFADRKITKDSSLPPFVNLIKNFQNSLQMSSVIVSTKQKINTLLMLHFVFLNL